MLFAVNVLKCLYLLFLFLNKVLVIQVGNSQNTYFSSLILVCTVCPGHFGMQLEFKNFEHLRHYWIFIASFKAKYVFDTHYLRTISERCVFWVPTVYEPRNKISNNVVCGTSKGSDQAAHLRSLIRAFASSLNILRVLSNWLHMVQSF